LVNAGLVVFLVQLPPWTLGAVLLEEVLTEEAREAALGVGSLVLLVGLLLLLFVVTALARSSA
jgi:hypothetical protein